MKLFYRPGSCSLAPHITLRELDLPCELELVDRETRKTRPGGLDYAAINDKPYVPALQLDDGQLLTENGAILQYLADQKPQMRFAPPPASLERYRLQEWLHFVGTEVHKVVSPLFNPKVPDEAKKAFRERVAERLGLVEKALGKQPFLMGGHPTVADVYLNVVLSWSPRIGLDLAPFPTLQGWHRAFFERPAVKAALEAEKKA